MLASLLLLLLLLLAAVEVSHGQSSSPKYSRDDFPPAPSFVFGAGTSAYQVEGAAAEDGRTPSIWDTFTHAGNMKDNSTGDVTADEYHKYREDVKLMVDIGLEAYRLSISWSRLLPNGRGAINPKGLKYYNNLINELVKYGIQPHVSLFQQDLPQVLENEYEGWLSPKIVDDFAGYADVCFREFGDRVLHWTTLVQPNVIGLASYDTGTYPPQHCSYPFGIHCTKGNSTMEPYVAVHHMLLAHAAAANLYKTKYQALQNGRIGLNIYTYWCYPLTNSSADIEATQRVMDFNIGWVLNPLMFGDYPKIMKMIVGSRLPLFTKFQSEQVKGSFDFIGINQYSSVYISDYSNGPKMNLRDYCADCFAKFTVSKNETPTPQFIPSHIRVDPAGLQYTLEYIKKTYGNLPVYVHENGYGIGSKDTLNDTARIDYISGFIGSMLNAIGNGADVRGYFVWSFHDVFEFLEGFSSPYGLIHVNFEDKERPRQPKLSAIWYSNFLKKSNEMKIQTSAPNTIFYSSL